LYPSYYSHPITKARSMAISGADGLRCARPLEQLLLGDAQRLVVMLTRRRFWEGKGGVRESNLRDRCLPDRAGTQVNPGVRPGRQPVCSYFMIMPAMMGVHCARYIEGDKPCRCLKARMK
jgi:hypothetical protein